MGKKSFVMYKDWKSAFNKMSDEQAGKMIKAVFQYQSGDTDISFDDPALPFFFEIIKEKFEENNEKYKEICERNKENGMSGGRPKTEKTQNNPVGFEEPKITHSERKNPDNDSDNENDKDLKEKGSPTESRKRKTFTPPTLEEVEDFCRERNSPVDPKQFYEYFNTGGWVDSKGNKVKSWKQKVITWEKFNQGHGDNRASQNPKVHNFVERQYSHDDLDSFEKVFARN